MTKKQTSAAPALVAGITGLAAAAIAGSYFFYGKDGAKHRKHIKSWSLKAKGDVVEKIEKTKAFTEEAFHQAIDAAVAKYSKVKNVTPEELEAFAKDLKKHWKDIKKEIAPAPKKAVSKK